MAGGDVLPHVYRITKCDPADRDQHGHYIGAEAEISDHGPVEAAYLMAVAAFAEDTGIGQLAIREPEISGFAHFGPEPHGRGPRTGGPLPTRPRRIPRRRAGADRSRPGTRPGHAARQRCMVPPGGRRKILGACRVGPAPVRRQQCGRAAALARTRALGLFPERMDASPYDFVLDQQHVQRPADADFWARLRWVVSSYRATFLEETYVRNASRWHRLTYENIETVRAQLAPRTQLAVWPDLLTEVDEAVAALPDEGTVEILWEDANGRISRHDRRRDPVRGSDPSHHRCAGRRRRTHHR